MSVWFGLRPIEIDRLYRKPPVHKTAANAGHRFDFEERHETFVVFQWKLTGVPADERWKHIPILFDERRQGVEKIKRRGLERPLPKTLRRYLQKGANNYWGRKGFEYLMQSKGRSLLEAKDWLGHHSLDRTWQNYRKKGLFIGK